MKIDVYDYTKMEGGRPAHSMIDIEDEMEERLKTWNRNGWVVGIVPEENSSVPRLAVMDFLSDVILHTIPVPAVLLDGVKELFAVDPPQLTEAYRRAVEPRRSNTQDAEEA